ncbi:hypothetical protein [uncultured Tyzzerella sp.]|uniref:hypothetical protein n=1 Tax=uncultured Tyzzerella sp. TaxID=2321398 RepID=UPI0029432561|nr:hypothetical protein [uncultured Tyzzerella sp.]
MVFLPIKNKYKQKSYFHIDNSKAPFFYILTHQYTSKSFINLIRKNKLLEAKNFISKAFAEDVNISILKEFFNDDYVYKTLDKVSFYKNKYEKINAFLIMDKNSKFKGIINFYMINEPDNISQWKIYKITKETTY